MAGNKRTTFTVSETEAEYAPEVLYCQEGGVRVMDQVAELTGVVEALPTNARIDVDLLRPGASATSEDSSDWILAYQSFAEAGAQPNIALANVRGVRLRCRSGGTAGTAIVSTWWW